jgi:CRP-like cAMP-binding protein
MTRQDLLRGRLLVEQGTSSDALFLVLNGALAVYRKDHVGLPSSAGLPTLIGQQNCSSSCDRVRNERHRRLLRRSRSCVFDSVTRLFLSDDPVFVTRITVKPNCRLTLLTKD